ncbi:hypothetical protein SRHO_G00101820 [Serrasalmus rhombeus]
MRRSGPVLLKERVTSVFSSSWCPLYWTSFIVFHKHFKERQEEYITMLKSGEIKCEDVSQKSAPQSKGQKGPCLKHLSELCSGM